MSKKQKVFLTVSRYMKQRKILGERKGSKICCTSGWRKCLQSHFYCKSRTVTPTDSNNDTRSVTATIKSATHSRRHVILFSTPEPKGRRTSSGNVSFGRGPLKGPNNLDVDPFQGSEPSPRNFSFTVSHAVPRRLRHLEVRLIRLGQERFLYCYLTSLESSVLLSYIFLVFTCKFRIYLVSVFNVGGCSFEMMSIYFYERENSVRGHEGFDNSIDI